MQFTDKWLICADCGRQFLWDAGEQAWYHDKSLENEPKHCRICRARRRDDRLHQPRQYFKTACERCGVTTFVPFIPHGTKPIYCRACISSVRV
jgi:CxxC-x17-CxxC domain-containing protein